MLTLLEVKEGVAAPTQYTHTYISTNYIFLFHINCGLDLVLSVCMNASNSVTSKATDTKFGMKNTAYDMQIKCTSNISKHAQRPDKSAKCQGHTVYSALQARLST